jgi:hypothetical protein
LNFINYEKYGKIIFENLKIFRNRFNLHPGHTVSAPLDERKESAAGM